jgi:hypothetical protein
VSDTHAVAGTTLAQIGVEAHLIRADFQGNPTSITVGTNSTK